MNKKNVIKLTLTIAAMLAFALYLNAPEYKYDITHPVNDKHHAIIQIKNNNGYNCSAFVIDDNRAVTAGHCVDVTKYFMDTTYKQLMKNSEEIQRKAILMLHKIKTTCIGPYCKRMYNEYKAKYNAEVAAYNKAKNKKIDVLKVFNMYGEDTKVTAIALYKNTNARDYAILKGDFSGFNKLRLASGFDVNFADKLRSCGFAGGLLPPVCIDITYITNINFMLYGYGLLIKGMSGGPILNEHGLVVGINSSVPITGAMFSPIIGMFNRSGMKRPKK